MHDIAAIAHRSEQGFHPQTLRSMAINTGGEIFQMESNGCVHRNANAPGIKRLRWHAPARSRVSAFPVGTFFYRDVSRVW